MFIIGLCSKSAARYAPCTRGAHSITSFCQIHHNGTLTQNVLFVHAWLSIFFFFFVFLFFFFPFLPSFPSFPFFIYFYFWEPPKGGHGPSVPPSKFAHVRWVLKSRNNINENGGTTLSYKLVLLSMKTNLNEKIRQNKIGIRSFERLAFAMIDQLYIWGAAKENVYNHNIILMWTGTA